MDNTVAFALPRYDSPTGVAIVFLVSTIVMAACVVVLLAFAQRSRDRLYDRLAETLAKRGWQPSLQLPHNAIDALIETRFSVYAPWSDYSCAHSIHSNAATLYLAVAKWAGGRGERANTVVVATADLRSPVECLIATNSQTHESSQPGLQLICLRPRGDHGQDLYVYFKSKHAADDRQIAKTYRIIGLIFDGVESVLSPESVALLGPKGLVIRGPTLGGVNNVEQIVEPLVNGAAHLLDRSEAVWKENRD